VAGVELRGTSSEPPGGCCLGARLSLDPSKAPERSTARRKSISARLMRGSGRLRSTIRRRLAPKSKCRHLVSRNPRRAVKSPSGVLPEPVGPIRSTARRHDSESRLPFITCLCCGKLGAMPSLAWECLPAPGKSAHGQTSLAMPPPIFDFPQQKLMWSGRSAWSNQPHPVTGPVGIGIRAPAVSRPRRDWRFPGSLAGRGVRCARPRRLRPAWRETPSGKNTSRR